MHLSVRWTTFIPLKTRASCTYACALACLCACAVHHPPQHTDQQTCIHCTLPLLWYSSGRPECTAPPQSTTRHLPVACETFHQFWDIRRGPRPGTYCHCTHTHTCSDMTSALRKQVYTHTHMKTHGVNQYTQLHSTCMTPGYTYIHTYIHACMHHALPISPRFISCENNAVKAPRVGATHHCPTVVVWND